MRFIKEDFQEKQRKKRMIMVYVSTALMAVAVIWYAFIRTSPGPGTGPAAAARGDQPPKPVKAAAEARKTSPGKIMDLPALVKRVKESIVVINTLDRSGNPLGQGSGFFVNGKGHVVSNRHVFHGADRAEVKSPKGTYKVKKILAEDANND